MTAPRFFVSGRCETGLDIALDDDDAHHAAHVLRAKAGDPIVAIAADGPWDGVITVVTKRAVRARIGGRSADEGGELPVEVTVLQAVTKGAKFDDVVEKTVELGARRIVPVRCARSYGDATAHRVERWRRIARSAAAQSRRRILPDVTDPLPWGDAISSFSATMPVIVGWERSSKGSLATAIARCASSTALAIAVGPEGSLADEEIEAARAAGCSLVWLGPTILRTDTAAAAMLAGLASGCGWW
jgi:16S rRNA (uracil1498-N3)-methyltransferase